MPLYIKMDQKTWVRGDYTNSASFDLSGTVYDENTFTTTRDISGYTGLLRLLDNEGRAIYSSGDNLTLGADGTILIKFSNTNTVYARGLIKVRLRLTDSNNRLTCVGVNGSDEIFIEND